jgi:DNA-nicking Smr family endonuclease
MDFGDILAQWDRIKEDEPSEAEADPQGKEIEDADSGERPDRAGPRRRLESLKPQATLDLHGMTAEESESAIRSFIDASAREGLEKVLVIHGKGLHSEGGRSVLKGVARKALESHPLAGRIGEASSKEGGSGALWVAIRKRSCGE